MRVRDGLSYAYTYNPQGRLASVTDFANAVTSFEYVSNDVKNYSRGMLNKITDPLGREITYTYNSEGQANQQTEPGGGVRTFKYGKQRTELRDMDGSIKLFLFDENDRTTMVKLPDGTRKYSKYHPDGRLAETHIDGGGVYKYNYDANGNLSQKRRPLDQVATQITYDHTFNKPVSIFRPGTGATAYTFDEFGGIASESRSGLTNTFTRDAFGNVLTMNNGLGIEVFERDENGLVIKLPHASNEEIRQYDSRNRLQQSSFASGRVLNYEYDNYDRVVRTSAQGLVS